MNETLSVEVLTKIIESILTILVSVGVYFIIKAVLEHRAKKLKRGKHLTYLRLFRSIAKYALIILAFLVILQICGIDTVSIVAGLGVASVIAGLALQDALKDIIMGFNIITDGFFAVGDVVEVNGVTGKVMEIGVKAVRLRNLLTGDIEVIANRNISASTIVSKRLDIDLPLPYEEPVEKIEGILGEFLEKIKKEIEVVNDAEYLGIKDYGDSAVLYKLRFTVNAEQKIQTERNIRRLLKDYLDKKKISIPYTQIDLHQI